MNNYEKIFSDTECLTQSEFDDYINDKISQIEKHRIEKHINDCEMCRDELAGLLTMKDKTELPVIVDEINARIKRRIKRRIKGRIKRDIFFRIKKSYSIAASIILLVGVSFIIGFYMTSQNEISLAHSVPEKKFEEKAIMSNNISENKNDNTKKIISEEKKNVFENKKVISNKVVTKKTDANIKSVEPKKSKNKIIEENNTDLTSNPPAANYGAEIVEEEDNEPEVKEIIKKDDAPVLSTKKIAAAIKNKKSNDNNVLFGGANRSVISKNDYDELKKTAILIFDAKEYKSASEDFEKLIEKNDKDAEVFYYSGLSFFNLEKYETALKRFEQANEQKENKYIEDAEWYIALSCEQLNNKSDTEKALLNVIKRDGKYKQKAEKKLKETGN